MNPTSASPVLTTGAPVVSATCPALGGRCASQHDTDQPEMHQGPVFTVDLADQPRENIPFTAHLVQLDPEPGFPLAHEIWVDFRGTVLELKTPQDVALLRARLAVFDAGLAALGQELAGVKGATCITVDGVL